MPTIATVAAGSERPILTITWEDADGATMALTAAALTGYTKNKVTDAVQQIQGALAVTDAANGMFTWTPDPADVATAGAYHVQFSAAFVGEPTPARSAVYLWVVEESIIPTDAPAELPDYQGVVTMLDRTTDPDAAAAGKVGLFVGNGTLYTIDADGVRVGPIIGDYTDAMAQAIAADAVAAHVSDTTPHASVQGAITLGGDGSNHVAIAADGTLSLVGTAVVWDDIRIEPVARTTGTFAPTFEQYFTNGAGSRGVYLYSFDDAAVNAEKEIYFTLQLPHAWAQTAIHLHIHFIPFATVNASAVRWGLEYTWAEPDTVFGNTSIVYASAVEGGSANMVANTHYITEFAALTPSAAQDGFSSTLIGRVFRNSSHASDTYTNKAGLLYIDAHVQLNKLGSNDEYA